MTENLIEIAENNLKKAKIIDQFLRKRKKYLNACEKADNALKVFDKTCTHPNLTYKHRGTGGGWDYDPSYWTEWKCDICDSRWTTDQREEERKTLKSFPHAVNIGR